MPRRPDRVETKKRGASPLFSLSAGPTTRVLNHVESLGGEGGLRMGGQVGRHAVLEKEFLAFDLFFFEFVLLRREVLVLQLAEPSFTSLMLVMEMAVLVVGLNQLLFQGVTIRVGQSSSFSHIVGISECCSMSEKIGRVELASWWAVTIITGKDRQNCRRECQLGRWRSERWVWMLSCSPSRVFQG